jgi:hypothetical protein
MNLFFFRVLGPKARVFSIKAKDGLFSQKKKAKDGLNRLQHIGMAYHPEQLSIKALNQQTPPEYKRHQTATTRHKSRKFGKQLQVLNELLNHQEQSPSNLHVVN